MQPGLSPELGLQGSPDRRGVLGFSPRRDARLLRRPEGAGRHHGRRTQGDPPHLPEAAQGHQGQVLRRLRGRSGRSCPLSLRRLLGGGRLPIQDQATLGSGVRGPQDHRAARPGPIPTSRCPLYVQGLERPRRNQAVPQGQPPHHLGAHRPGRVLPQVEGGVLAGLHQQHRKGAPCTMQRTVT